MINQFRSHVSQFLPEFTQLGFGTRLDKYNRMCVTINRLTLQSIEMLIQMYSCDHGDVKTDNSFM